MSKAKREPADRIEEDGYEREMQEADAPENVETVPAVSGVVPVSVDSMSVDSKAREAAGEEDGEEEDESE